MPVIGYIRVSTEQQDLDKQQEWRITELLSLVKP